MSFLHFFTSSYLDFQILISCPPSSISLSFTFKHTHSPIFHTDCVIVLSQQLLQGCPQVINRSGNYVWMAVCLHYHTQDEYQQCEIVSASHSLSRISLKAIMFLLNYLTEDNTCSQLQHISTSRTR